MTITKSPRRAKAGPVPISGTPAEKDPRPTNRPVTPTGASSDASNSPAANGEPLPRFRSPQEPASPATIVGATAGRGSSRGIKTAGRRASLDIQRADAAGTNSRSAIGNPGPEEDAPSGLNVPDPTAMPGSMPSTATLLDPALALAADVLDDIERVRTANVNRIRQMTRTEEDADGETRGLRLDPDHPDVLRIAVLVHALEGLENDAILELQRKMRKHPLGAWMKTQRGIGLKQGARLLTSIGDPYWRPELVYRDAEGNVTRKVPEGPRTVSALWAYCGLHVLPGGDQRVGDAQSLPVAAGDQNRDTDQVTFDTQTLSVGVAAKRRKGQRANWSTRAKTKAYLVAESCMKTGRSPQCRDGHISRDGHSGPAVPACACSPYRLVYENRRAHTATTHPDWTAGHSHNDALRVVSKEVLKQLWRAARDWHAERETNGNHHR